MGSAGGSRQVRVGDAIGKIERLQKLREEGALTEVEFDREKAKILAEQWGDRRGAAFAAPRLPVPSRPAAARR